MANHRRPSVAAGKRCCERLGIVDVTRVDFVADNRVIFDVAGNRYRLIVHVSYRFKRVLVKFVGTHKDYNRIDPETV